MSTNMSSMVVIIMYTSIIMLLDELCLWEHCNDPPQCQWVHYNNDTWTGGNVRWNAAVAVRNSPAPLLTEKSLGNDETETLCRASDPMCLQ